MVDLSKAISHTYMYVTFGYLISWWVSCVGFHLFETVRQSPPYYMVFDCCVKTYSCVWWWWRWWWFYLACFFSILSVAIQCHNFVLTHEYFGHLSILSSTLSRISNHPFNFFKFLFYCVDTRTQRWTLPKMIPCFAASLAWRVIILTTGIRLFIAGLHCYKSLIDSRAYALIGDNYNG